MKKVYLLFTLTIVLNTTMLQAQESPSVFTYTLGDGYEIHLLSEVQQKGNTSILIGATTEMIESIIPDKTFPNAVNAFLVKTPDRNILVDAGLGIKLTENLKSLNVEPNDIDVILITHMHGDHIGGLLKDDQPIFKQAIIYLPLPEYNYWMSNDEMNKVPEKANGFLQARKTVGLYKKQLLLFEPAGFSGTSNVLPEGIKGIAAYGHTPGHTMYLLEREGNKLLIWGDLAHAMAIQMSYPQVAVTYDVNPNNATKAREHVLQYVSENNIPIAGMHIAFPAIGSILKNNTGGYSFVPKQ